MTDFKSEEEFAPIAAAMKELPYFAPSPDFADKVMARVRLPGAARVPAAVEKRDISPARPRPVAYPQYDIDRRASPVPATDVRRSIPARIAVAGLVATLGVTMATVALVAFFNLDLLMLVSRVFGPGTMTFLSSLVTDASATASATASGAVASAGTATGAAVVGSFAAGVVAATVALRAAASASRRAA